jgi:hypothetical protein
LLLVPHELNPSMTVMIPIGIFQLQL